MNIRFLLVSVLCGSTCSCNAGGAGVIEAAQRTAASGLKKHSASECPALLPQPKEAAWQAGGTIQALTSWRDYLFAGAWEAGPQDPARPAQVWRYKCGGANKWEPEVVFSVKRWKITSLAVLDDQLIVGAGDGERASIHLYRLALNGKNKGARGGAVLFSAYEWTEVRDSAWITAGFPWAMIPIDDSVVVGTATQEASFKYDYDVNCPTDLVHTATAFVAAWRPERSWMVGANGPWTKSPPGRACGYEHVDALLLDTRGKNEVVVYAALAAAAPRSAVRPPQEKDCEGAAILGLRDDRSCGGGGGAAVWRYSAKGGWEELGGASFLDNGVGSQWAEDLAIVDRALFVALAPDDRSPPRWPPLRRCSLEEDCKRDRHEEWSPVDVSAWGEGVTQLGRILEMNGRLFALPGYGKDVAGGMTRLFEADLPNGKWRLWAEFQGCKWAYAAIPWGDAIYVGLSECASAPRIERVAMKP